jgi:hypothetical protein
MLRMKRQWLILIAGALTVILIGVVVKVKFFSKAGPGALQISSIPKAQVFIDGNQAGLTPVFDDNIIAGEHTVKLVPESTEGGLAPWEGRVLVTSNILTVINRELAADESSASGEIMSLEKIGQKNMSSLAIVSVPDQSVVRVNGEPKGFTPVQLDELTPGDYQVVVSSPGYKERTVSANTLAGYKLTVSVKLAQQIEEIEEASAEEEEEAEEEEKEEEKEETEEVSPTPSPEGTPQPTGTPPAKPYVIIKETSTGWLRVRQEPNTSSAELAKLNPGEMYPYLEEEKNGWYKIEHEDGEEGWISGVYADLVE